MTKPPGSSLLRPAGRQFERAFKFRETLDKAARKPANFTLLDDLSSTGLDYEYDKAAHLVQHARVSGSNLDHAVAADHPRFWLELLPRRQNRG